MLFEALIVLSWVISLAIIFMVIAFIALLVVLYFIK